MVFFKTNIDNDEYITIDKTYLLQLVVSDKRPKNIRDEANNIFAEALAYQKTNRVTYISEIQIKKDSLLGKYLLENGMSNEIINEDLYVYYEDVVNAFNIAIFENNSVSHILSRLFKEREEGSTIELSKKYGTEVIDYIANNKDFEIYLKKIDGIYEPEEYIVYEDGEFSKKTLLTNKKQKIK